MRTFQDNAGRGWTVEVNVAAVKRVRDLLKEDLLEIETILPRLYADPVLLCDVVYCLCKPQADERQVTDEQFGQAMAGDALADAQRAVLEELADFFQSPLQRERMKKTVALLGEITEREAKLAVERLDDPGLKQKFEKLFQDHFARLTAAIDGG